MYLRAWKVHISKINHRKRVTRVFFSKIITFDSAGKEYAREDKESERYPTLDFLLFC